MTAANSTPLTDGASAIVLASGEKAAELGIEPLARVVSSAVYGIDPLIMGLAPAWAIPLAIHRAALTPEQIDVGNQPGVRCSGAGHAARLPNRLDGFTVPDDKLTPNGELSRSAIRSARPAPATS